MTRHRPLLLALTLSIAAAAAFAAPDREEAAREHVRALEGLVSVSTPDGEASLRQRLTRDYAAALSTEQLRDAVETIRKAVAAAGAIMVREDERGLRLQLRGGLDADVLFAVEPAPPYRISSLEVITEGLVSERGGGEDLAPLDWDTLEDALEAAEREGFAGTVLAVRGGETVLHRGYGLANREAGIAASTATIYDIGSMPIDFTRAAILLLAQEGALRLDDPIGRFFDDVPEDKRSMLVEHLMSGRSGLANFHHVAGEDEDYDLTYIDRDTAVERILSQPLLFAPGEGRSHSHSAFGLLAAIVEIVSETSYGDFLRQRFFGPAGMASTGFYGEDLGLDHGRFAVGYSEDQASDPNIPPKWGPASWLVMGSGGMVSNPGDMRRFDQLLEAGGVLHGEGRRRMLAPGAGAGGTDRGFFFLRVDDGAGNAIYLATNVGGRFEAVQDLEKSIARLVLPPRTD